MQYEVHNPHGGGVNRKPLQEQSTISWLVFIILDYAHQGTLSVKPPWGQNAHQVSVTSVLRVPLPLPLAARISVSQAFLIPKRCVWETVLVSEGTSVWKTHHFSVKTFHFLPKKS